LRDENGTVQLFNNGITGGDIFYQGYVIPLTTEQLIDGYYSILETGQWTDPRYAIINDYNDKRNLVNQVRAPMRSGADITVEGRYADAVSLDAKSGMIPNHHAARAFLDEHTTGSFTYYGQMGGSAQTVDINYGRDGNGDFITLKDLFENRVPGTGNNGLTRVDRENILPAGFVQGVDRVPEIDELYQFYTDALIYASARNPNIQYAYDYADNVMAGLPEELFNKWKEHTPVKRWDQDDAFLSELKKAVRPADLLSLNHYTEVDTDLLRDYAETISGSGEGGAYKKYFNTVADAIDKFVDDPGSLTAEEKEYLNQYRVAQTDLYLSTDPLDEDEFEVEGTALSDVSRLADYQNAQNFWLDRETKYGDNQGIRDNIDETWDYEFGAWEPDPENPYDRPPEFGMSMISQANGGLQFSNGQAFFGGTNVAVDDVVVWDEDGKGYGRIEWGAYVNSWQQDVNRMGLPAYQETDVLGVDLETSKRFTELATNKDRNEAQEEEYQALAQELSSNTMDLFGDDIAPVWYDASRLYIKTPFHDHAAAEAAGFTSEEMDFSRNRQITNRGFNSGGAYNNQIPSYVEGDSLDYSTFANPGDERNEGHGFFLDITGGDAPVGSYSMVWVSQPEWYEPPDQSFWEFILNSPIVGIVASIISPMYGNMVVAGLKAASGMTLHASDWLSIGIGALKMSGQLQMPVDPEVANEMATTAAGDALTAAETAGQTLTELEKATLLLETYNSAYDIAITGFGIGTLSAAQTVSLMNVVAYEGDIGTALLGAFGDEYLVKSLSVAGIDISNLPDNVTGWMTEITTEMINGTSFDDAIKLTAGTEFLGYLQDSVEDSKVYATAKNILEEAVEEIDQATQAVQTMANDLGDGIDATISAIGDSMDTDLLAELRDASKNIRTSINSIGESIGNIATELNAEVLTPVTDAVKNNMSKFVTMAGLDNQNLFSLSGDSAADADSLMDDIKGFVGDTVFESVPDAIKATLREAAIQKIALGEVDQNELKLMATRGSITIEAVSNLDGDLVDAIGPRILTKALQNTLTAATFGGDPGKAFLDTIADSTVQSIQTAMASGGWPQVVKKFDQFEDDITGKSREAQAAADEYNKIGTDFNALETRQKELDTEHNTAIEEIARLEGLALADGAGDEEMQAYLTYVENYAVRSQAIGEELAQIKTDKDALIAALPAAEEKYDTAVSAVNDESARLDPLLQKEFDNLYVNALVAVHPEIKMAEYATVSGMEWEGEYPTAEEIAEHFLSEGIQNGVPVNIEEYNARRDAGASQYVISALRASGIDATKLTDDERKNITNYLLNEHATVKAEENGQTVVEYLEDFNETPDNFEAGEKALEAAYVLEEGFGTAPEAVALTVANRRANYAFNALGMSAEDVRNIANNEVSYTIDPVNGGIMWGGDGFMMREWNSTTKQFDTYQYDAGGGLKYKLNEDGSEPLIRQLIQTPMFNGIADLAEDSPASYMTFLATAPTDAAVTAQVNYLSQADRDADELQRMKDIQAAIKDAPEDDGRFAIPDSELPWIVRVARDWLDHSQEVENALLADVEYLENLEGPLSIDDELRLEFARGAYAVAEGNTEFLATWVVKTPTKIASFMQTSINAFTAWSQGIAAEKKADGFRRQALYEGKSAEEADAIFREKYAEFKQDIDYSSIIHNDANQTHNLMESLARGVMPDSYLADQKEMSENIAAADGALDTVIAITGEIIDKPDVFLGTYIAEELPTAIFGLGLGSAAGRLTSLAAAKVVGKEAAESLATGSTVSMGASRVADLSEAFGETAYATYEEAKQELERIGYEGDIEAKAQEIAIKAGTTAMVLVGATAPFGAFALDNAILNASTKKAVKEVAQRVEGLGDTLTKETVTEVIQGGFTQGATEVFLYNAGVTDRDVAGNIAGSATLEGLVGGTTAGIITGLSTPTDTGTGFDGGDPFASLLFSNPDIKGAVEAGDATQVQALLGERNLTDTPLYVEVMNTVDDANYVTPTEVRQAFGYLGVQPTGDEVVALTNKEGITDATLEAEAEAYWAETYGEELLGTGRTTAQHYDIIQHMTDMINGVVPLDSSFNMNGDTTLDQADIDTYIAKLPLREQNLYNQYDPTDHEPTGIIEDLGGSLMNIADMDKLKQDIQTILDRGESVTAQEVVDMLLLDPTNKALLKGQIEAAVGNEFAKLDNQNAFAAQVINKLVEEKTIETKSKDAIKELFGDPNGNTVEEQGVFGIIEGLKNMLDLGESDATTLAGYITDKIGTAVELDEDGKIKAGTGSGLLGTLTRNGVLRDVAIAELATVLGSAGDGTEGNPATGIYAIANDAADTKAAVDRIEADYGTLDTEYTALKSLYDTAITNMQTNLGSPGIADDPATDVDEYRSPTGLYALVGKAIAAGDGAKSAVTALLGEYVDFAAFEDALELTMKGKVDEVVTAFGTPPVYETEDDGTIKRNAAGEPIIKDAATGYHLDMYNAMQLQGVEQDLAFTALNGKINAALTQVEQVSSAATADTIKTNILNEYFPAKPEDYEVGRAIATELDYVQSLIASGQFDANYDRVGDTNVITQEDYNDLLSNATPEQITALENYNTWSSNTTAISPMLEAITRETGTNFAIIDRRIDSVASNVNDYIRNNVISSIGKPADTLAGTGATGIYKAIEDGDTSILDVLGTLGTLEDGVLTGGSGILRDMQLLGMDTTAINDYLINTLGKPADGGTPASGIFAAVDANQTTLNDIETWFTGTINALNEVVPDLATEADKISQEDISKAITAKLGDVLLNTELTNATDISTAVVAAIGTPEDQLNYQALLEKENRNEEEEAELARLGDKLYLATDSDKISSKDIQDAVTSQLGDVLLNNELITATNISNAVVAAIGNNEGQLNLATAGDKISSTDIQKAITDKLGAVLEFDELITKANISEAVVAAIGDGEGQLNLATLGDKISSEDIQKAITAKLGDVLEFDELITKANISAAVVAAIGDGEGQLNLATEADKISQEDIGKAVTDKLQDVLLNTELTNATDISNAVVAAIGTPEDQLNYQALLEKENRNEEEEAELARLGDKLYLATDSDKISSKDIQDAVTSQLGDVLLNNELITATNISNAVVAAIGNNEGQLNLATAGDKISSTDIQKAITDKLGAVLEFDELITKANISEAVVAAIGDGEGQLNLATLGDKISSEDIQKAITAKLGDVLEFDELITKANISAAVVAAIGDGEGQLNLATEADKISQEDIGKAVTDKLQDVLLNTELTNATDISNAVVAAIGTPEDQLNYQALLEKENRNEEEEAELARLGDKLYLATDSDKISSKDIQDAVTSQLGDVLLNNELITATNISNAVVAAIGNNEGQLNLATAGDKISSTDIQKAITDKLGAVLEFDELITKANISEAVVAAIGDGEGQLNLATLGDKISSEDIQKAITAKLGDVLEFDELITKANISAAVVAAIGDGEGQLNLATEADKISQEDIGKAVTDKLQDVLLNTELTNATDISNAVVAAIGTPEDQLNYQALLEKENRNEEEEAELARLGDKLYLATDSDKISSKDIQDAVTSQLGDVLLNNELITATNISNAVVAAIGDNEGQLNLATAGDKISSTDIQKAITDKLGAVLEFDELITKANISEAVVAAIGDGEGQLNLATLGDKISSEDIQKAITAKLGDVLEFDELITKANISAAVVAAIGDGEGQLNLATEADKISQEDIGKAVTDKLQDVLLNTELTNATDISNAVVAAIGTPEDQLNYQALLEKENRNEEEEAELARLGDKLYLATDSDKISSKDIQDAVTSQLGDVLLNNELITATNISNAVVAAIGNNEGQLNLATAGDKISSTDIQKAITDKLGAVLEFDELITKANISEAVVAAIGDGEGQLNLATLGDKISSEDIQKAITAKLGDVLEFDELITKANISAAVVAAIGDGEGQLNLATEADKISQEDIGKAVTDKLQDVLLNTELTNATDISNAVVAAIGTPEDQLNYQALLEKENRNEEEEAELARLGDKLYLATDSDKISSKDIQDAVTSQLGDVLLNNELITATNISNAVVAAIGDNEGQLNLATAGDKISSTDIQKAITDNLEDVLLNTELTNATDIANAVIAAIGDEDGQFNLATATDKISSEDIQKAITDNLTGVLLSDQLITSGNISDAVNSVIGTSEDQAELGRLSQLDTRDDTEQAEFERLSSLLYLATTDDVLSAEELATAVQTDELKNVATVDSLLDAGDISGAVNAAIGEDGLDLATKSDVLDSDEVAAAVTTQLNNMIASGETVSAATIQDAIANQTVAIGQVVSAEQAGLATSDQLTEATQDLATSDDIQMLADLIGKPVNLLTQEDYILATNYLDSIQQDIDVAEADALRYDVTGDQQLTQQDLDLMQGTLDTGDYSQFADTSQFRDTATGMLGREQQLEAELAARDFADRSG
jgi:hypothetical protein